MNKIATWIKQIPILLKTKTTLVFVTLCVIYLISRFYNLSQAPVWEDNFSWLYRLNYYPWILETVFKGHPEVGKDLAYAGKISYHPGVTVMTLSGASTRIGKKVLTAVDSAYTSCGYNDASCKYLAEELLMAKLPLIVLGAGLVLLCSLLLNKLFGFSVAMLWNLIILMEPVFYITSRDLHLDFLQSILLLTSILLIFVTKKFLSTKKQLLLISAGGCLFGLAMLTRFASVLIIPGILVFVLGYFSSSLKNKLITLTIFFCISLATFVALYPPMWVAPVSTVKYIVEGSTGSTKGGMEGLTKPSYGQGIVDYLTQAQPQISTLFWVGIVLLSYTMSKKPDARDDKYRAVIYLLFITASYFALLNLSDKRFFRYLTPILMNLSVCISYCVSTFLSQKAKTLLN